MSLRCYSASWSKAFRQTSGMSRYILFLVLGAVLIFPMISSSAKEVYVPAGSKADADLGIERAMAADIEVMGSVHTFTKRGGWCWYQDPRALIHDGKLLVGSIPGSGAQGGDVQVSAFDLDKATDLGTRVLHEELEQDDHVVPALYARPDGRILAVYATHASEQHYYRISAPGNPLQWGPEKTYRHPSYTITYMNLYYDATDKLLYNFYRANDETYSPHYIVSDDHGDSWREGGHFIAHGQTERHRPYPRFCSDGEYLHMTFTEANPQQYPGGCSIYYAKFKGGKFFKANGEFIKDLKTGGPLLPTEAELIFQGDDANSAWTSSIYADASGQVFMAYTLRKTPADHRFRYAVWDGQAWHDTEFAYAGPGLYSIGFDYTGLATVDPADPGRVYLSTNVDPIHGTNLPSGRHEIFEAVTTDHGKSWRFAPVTADSKTSNLRPIAVAGEGWRALLWLRGPYSSFTDYDQEVVGMVQRIPAKP